MASPIPAPPATRQLLLMVWCARPGEFAARAVLADGSQHDFDSPFELVRFLAAPPVRTGAPAAVPKGLR